MLKPHLSIHPITYNDYLTDSVQEIQAARHDRAFDILSKESCGYTSESVDKDEVTVDLEDLLTILKDGTRPNVEDYSVSLAADVAAAYYKVKPLKLCF